MQAIVGHFFSFIYFDECCGISSNSETIDDRSKQFIEWFVSLLFEYSIHFFLHCSRDPMLWNNSIDCSNYIKSFSRWKLIINNSNHQFLFHRRMHLNLWIVSILILSGDYTSRRLWLMVPSMFRIAFQYLHAAQKPIAFAPSDISTGHRIGPFFS